MSDVVEKFLQYGVTSTLAEKVAANDLSVSKVRTLSQADLTGRYHLSQGEARELKRAVVRKPIGPDLVHLLLERSAYVCSVCKGHKSPAYVIHHIVPYEKTQDNSYANLIVLCPNDHDLAHQSGLSLRITPQQLRKSKRVWEKQVDLANAQRAARAIDVHEDSVDYVNINRIEELCIRLFGAVPETSRTGQLKRARILTRDGGFDQKYVHEHLSGGAYLFDYINCGETRHYSELLSKISEVTEFMDLSDAADHGWRATKKLEGHYAFFIGGVVGRRPTMPITSSTPAVPMYYNTTKIRIEWLLNPIFLMSNTSIGRISGKNHYIIYCLVRTVEMDTKTKKALVKASPLFIAQPKVSVDKTPAIAYMRRYAEEQEEDDMLEELA